MSLTLLVASAGGHLAELHRLRHRLPDRGAQSAWLTTDHPHSRSLLARETVYFVPNAPSRDWRAALRNAGLTRPVLRQLRPDWVVSNGASLAVSVLPQAALMGIRTDYIENSVRVRGPSFSGRILSCIPGIRLHTQYSAWSSRRWNLTGSFLDEWEPHKCNMDSALRRVVVTVGTEAWQFRALILRLLTILPPEAEVLWQTGSTVVDDLPIRSVRSLPATELSSAIASADVVIAHAGIGSAIAAIEQGRVPLLVPRRHDRKEAIDDHQVDIGRELARRGLAVFSEVDVLTSAHVLSAAGLSAHRRAEVPPLLLA